MKTSAFLILLILGIVFISGCIQQTDKLITDTKSDEIQKPLTGTKDGAEKTAVEFSVFMSKQNYGDVYKLLIPEIQNLYNSKDFSDIMYDKFKDADFIYDKTVLISNNEAYAYYKLKSGIIETSIEPIKLEFYNGEWRINALVGMSYDIQQKKESEAELSKHKYFFRVGEEAVNDNNSVKITNAKITKVIIDKYNDEIKPSKDNVFLVFTVTTNTYPLFGDCIYEYNDTNIIGNSYFSSDRYCQKPYLTFVDESLNNKIKYPFTNENITGIMVYEVPSQITEFVIPYKNFYWDSYREKSVSIYFIVNL